VSGEGRARELAAIRANATACAVRPGKALGERDRTWDEGTRPLAIGASNIETPVRGSARSRFRKTISVKR